MGRQRKTADLATYSGRVAARLRELREEAGLSVEELLERVQAADYPIAGASVLYSWENGGRQVPLDAVPALVKALRLRSAADFFPKK